MARRLGQECTMDMTPMIDCVFQLMIFFIVTINMEERANPEIELADGPHGPAIETRDEGRSTLVVEIDRRGKVSLQGLPVTRDWLRTLLRNRYNRHGQFPVLIRADFRTAHKDVRAVMDICSGIGIWRVSFAATKEKKVSKGA